MKNRECGGFTLLEVAIVLGVLGAVLLMAATLMTGTMEVYGNVSGESETVRQARQGLEMITRDIRESVFIDVSNPGEGALLGNITDAILIESARRAHTPDLFDIDNEFVVDGVGFPQTQSIILYYLNTTPEGINQLVRHQLYYIQDLSLVPPPFRLLPAPVGPYVGQNIVILDGIGNPIILNRNTGGTAAVDPYMPPKILVNGSTSFDVIDDGPGLNPFEIRVTCQVTDQYGRSKTTRLKTQVEPRNN